MEVVRGNCEYEHGLNRDRRLTYLSGPLGVFAVYEELGPLYKGDGDDSDDSDEGEDLTDSSYVGTLYYLHRDHLGSVTTVTNASGGIVQELSYDAWGNLRNPATWSGSYTGVPRFDRGFTGHEHHRHFGLINMNGRMYDPVMSCFLSVDSYVQDPENPQNFNRYAYCLNNPLRYVDPSGEFLAWSINQNGFSIGLNFTPAGVPLGLGVNVGWANGGSVGFYTEASYRIGGTGLGAGVGIQHSIDYSFTSGWTQSTSAFGFVSYGCFSLGGSYGRNWTTNTGFWSVNAGVGLFYNSNMHAYYGGGLSIGYGLGCWTFGANGYYNRMQKPKTTILATSTTEGTGNLLPIGQEGDHGCLEAVYQWIAETYGMELTADKKAQITACIVRDDKGNWFLQSGNEMMNVLEIGHKAICVAVGILSQNSGFTAATS